MLYTAALGFLANLFRYEHYSLIGVKLINLIPKNKPLKKLKDFRYSFTNKNYIHPLIIKDLLPRLSDNGCYVTSINLYDGNDSNRYFGELVVNKNNREYPIVTSTIDDSYYSYQYIGCSFTGLHLVKYWENTGGTGIFYNILFLTITTDYYYNLEEKLERVILKINGQLALGDRFEVKVKFRSGVLHIRGKSRVENKIKKRLIII